MKASPKIGRLSLLASELIKCTSINPPGDTTSPASFAKEWLSKYGISSSIHEPVKGKASLVAKIGSGHDRLILNSHLDVVPVGDESRWDFPPFSGRVRRGRLFGRGASDTKGGCAALMEALVSLGRLEGELDGKVLLSLVADEETGGIYGTKSLLENGVLKGELAVVAEPTGRNTLIIGEKGLLRFIVTSKGSSGHASMAGAVGENAITKLTALISPIMSMHGQRYGPPTSMKRAAQEAGKLLVAITGKEAARRVPRTTTVNIGVINGGVKANVIPDTAEMEVDIRLPLGAKMQGVKQRLARLITNAGATMDVQAESKPNYSDPSGPYVQQFLAEAQKVTRSRLSLAVYWASTDSKHFREAGIPTVTYGPGDWSSIHSVNETASVRDIFRCSNVYFRFAQRMMQ